MAEEEEAEVAAMAEKEEEEEEEEAEEEVIMLVTAMEAEVGTGNRVINTVISTLISSSSVIRARWSNPVVPGGNLVVIAIRLRLGLRDRAEILAVAAEEFGGIEAEEEVVVFGGIAEAEQQEEYGSRCLLLQVSLIPLTPILLLQVKICFVYI